MQGSPSPPDRAAPLPAAGDTTVDISAGGAGTELTGAAAPLPNMARDVTVAFARAAAINSIGSIRDYCKDLVPPPTGVKCT